MYIQNDLGYFYLLTKNEQRADLKEYWQKNDETNSIALKDLREMITSSARRKKTIKMYRNHTSDAFYFGRSPLNDKQADELYYLGGTVITISKYDFDRFCDWCKLNKFKYELVATHDDALAAEDYYIYQE